MLVLVVCAMLLQIVFAAADTFPAALDRTFSDPLQAFNSWAFRNRATHPLFTGFFNPLADAFDWGLTAIESVLLWIPWFVLPIAVFLIIARTKKYRTALIAAIVLLYPGAVGLWEISVETLALMSVSVVVSLMLGIPLGVLAAFNSRAERIMRPILDAMQTIPATVYLIPVVLFFSIGRVPGAIATIIYAIPPAIRLTTLGLKQVPSEAVEAGKTFGSTRFQLLRKVQLPMALPSLMAGVNQTIMMALSIVVLATFVGAGGLGQAVLGAITRRRISDSLVAGFTIVAIAIVLDRVSASLAVRPETRRRNYGWWALGVLVVLVVFGRMAGWTQFPELIGDTFLRPLDGWIRSFRDVAYPYTTAFNDFLVADLIIPMRNLLTNMLAWPVLVALAAWLGWRFRGWGLALFNVVGLAAIGLVGMWNLAIETLVHTVVAVVLSAVIAIPIGVWAGRRPRVEKALTPILDTFQTIPAFVYLLPVVMLFTISAVPGIIASVLYAVPPGIRITALGIRHVPGQTVEASEAFGATPRQTLWGVRLPLAAPSIMLAINQVIMMVLAMVIIAGMVGAGALGFEAVRALTKAGPGLGFEVGLAIVFMAMILDRLTQAWADRLKPPAAAV